MSPRQLASHTAAVIFTCMCRAQIMESSQTLLHVLKRESVNLTKKKQTSS